MNDNELAVICVSSVLAVLWIIRMFLKKEKSELRTRTPLRSGKVDLVENRILLEDAALRKAGEVGDIHIRLRNRKVSHGDLEEKVFSSGVAKAEEVRVESPEETERRRREDSFYGRTPEDPCASE